MCFVLHDKVGFLLLAGRSIRCEHWRWSVCVLLVVDVRRLWSVVHSLLLLEVHHLLWARRHDRHGQAMRMLRVRSKVAMLS